MDRVSDSCRVAVCDDQEIYRRMLQLVLEDQPGIELVGEACDGVGAVDLVRRHRPDVLLLDVAMPELDGIEALPHIREASPATRVVMLTGFNDDRTRARAAAAGAFAYLEKGADAAAITAAVRGAC